MLQEFPDGWEEEEQEDINQEYPDPPIEWHDFNEAAALDAYERNM